MLAVETESEYGHGKPIICPIIAMYDIDGMPTESADEAFSAMIFLPNMEPMMVHPPRRQIVEVRLH